MQLPFSWAFLVQQRQWDRFFLGDWSFLDCAPAGFQEVTGFRFWPEVGIVWRSRLPENIDQMTSLDDVMNPDFIGELLEDLRRWLPLISAHTSEDVVQERAQVVAWIIFFVDEK